MRHSALAAPRVLASLLLAIALASCGRDVPPEPDATSDAPALEVVVSDRAAPVGAVVAVAIRARGLDRGLRGLEADLLFDSRQLAYAGQIVEPGSYTMAATQDSPSSRLRLITFGLGPLPERMVVLTFRVLAPGYADALRLGPTLSVGADGRLVVLVVHGGTEVDNGLPRSDGRMMDINAWAVELGERAPARSIVFVAGAGTIYGDATLDGSITLLDALAAADVGVGSQSLITNAANDNVIAANVEPANLPGLGEPDDANPPGRELNGTFVINLLDALAIANASVGQPAPIVGRPIPGRVVPGLRAVLSGVISADRTLRRDTVYELDGVVSVENGVTLTIEAGTRIEGQTATAGRLAVLRGAKIVAIGTRLQPVVFSCTPSMHPGCWGGLNINGPGVLNNDGMSSGNEIEPCPQKASPGNLGYYGGCQDGFNSGTLRYVRIENAGMATAEGVITPGLSLLGVGSGTVMDTIQVANSFGDGMYVSGGRAEFRAVLLTGNLGTGLRWSNGWQGRAQNVIVQQPASASPAVLGSNADGSASARRLTYPTIYNLTVIGALGTETNAPGLLLGHGTGGLISNAVILRTSGAGLQIDGAQGCALTADSLTVRASIFFQGQPNFSDDVDCIDEAAYALTPSLGNIVTNPGLAAPFLTLTPDFRPMPGSAASTGGPIPITGFFDPTLTYTGGAPIEGNVVPWFTGWTVGW